MKALSLLLALAACGACGREPAPAAVEAPLSAEDQTALVLAVRAQQEGRSHEVGALLAELLAREPPPVDAQYVAGEAAYTLGRHAEAAERLADAVARKPEFLASATTLGFAHFKLGQFAEASAAFRQVLAARPEAYKAHYGLGLVALTEGRLDAARPALERALALRPDYLKARFAWARLLQEEGRLDEAAPELEAVLAASPAHDEALYRLAQVRLAQGHADEAEALEGRRREVYALREELAGLEATVRSGLDLPATWERLVLLQDALGEEEGAARALQDGLRRFAQDPRLQALRDARSAGR